MRQSPHDHEYEDVQQQEEKVKNPQTSSKGSGLRQNEKESDTNRFKSILKKPTTFNDTDTNYGTERSPSPAQKTGSHFYLPMPPNTPRKKVQFLVESRKEEREELDDNPINKQEKIYENVGENVELKKKEEEDIDKSEESSGNSSEDGK